MASLNTTTTRGFSLIEVLVVSVVMLLVFGGLFAGFRYSLELISISRAKLSALTLANDRMEYIRSLSYNAVGTVSGIPAGLIAQTSTTTLNNVKFTQTVLIGYIDDSADGIGAADSNNITTDYKQAKVTLSWTTRGVIHEIFLVSNIIPRSIETSVGGGTLRVNVFDATVAPLPGAEVRVVNNTIAPAIDVTRTTDSTGVALFGGAPAGPDYEITVTAPGYSTDKTYKATTTLPNPTTQPIAVLAADISTMNFFIDTLASLSVDTFSSKILGTTTESFSSSSGIATSTQATTSTGTLVLTQTAGVYATSGTAYLAAVTPSPLAVWDSIVMNTTLPAQTAVRIRFYTGTSTYTLIPDSNLPGNNTGFTSSIVDISSLSVATYPSIVIGLVLTTANTAVTPQLDQVDTWYVTTKTPRSAAALVVTGAKTIGTLSDGSLVYKNRFSTTTDGVGTRLLSNIEWDSYTAVPTSYDVAEACPSNPIVVAPSVDAKVELLTVANTTNSFRVVVNTVAGVPLRSATIVLTRPSFSEITTSGLCGQGFFSGLTAATDYDLSVSVPGYATQTFSGVGISDDDIQTVLF